MDGLYGQKAMDCLDLARLEKWLMRFLFADVSHQMRREGAPKEVREEVKKYQKEHEAILDNEIAVCSYLLQGLSCSSLGKNVRMEKILSDLCHHNRKIFEYYDDILSFYKAMINHKKPYKKLEMDVDFQVLDDEQRDAFLQKIFECFSSYTYKKNSFLKNKKFF